MKQEITASENNGTWELTSLLARKRVLDSKWVYKIKHKADGSVEGTGHDLSFLLTHRKKVWILLRFLHQLQKWWLSEHCYLLFLLRTSPYTIWKFIILSSMETYRRNFIFALLPNFTLLNHGKFTGWKNYCMDFVGHPGVGFLNFLPPFVNLVSFSLIPITRCLPVMLGTYFLYSCLCW